MIWRGNEDGIDAFAESFEFAITGFIGEGKFCGVNGLCFCACDGCGCGGGRGGTYCAFLFEDEDFEGGGLGGRVNYFAGVIVGGEEIGLGIEVGGDQTVELAFEKLEMFFNELFYIFCHCCPTKHKDMTFTSL